MQQLTPPAGGDNAANSPEEDQRIDSISEFINVIGRGRPLVELRAPQAFGAMSGFFDDVRRAAANVGATSEEADLSDELTVEFLEMVRNWKRIDDELEPPEQARDIVEVVPLLFNQIHYAKILNQMNEQMHQLIMKFLKIDDQFVHGV